MWFSLIPAAIELLHIDVGRAADAGAAIGQLVGRALASATKLPRSFQGLSARTVIPKVWPDVRAI